MSDPSTLDVPERPDRGRWPFEARPLGPPGPGAEILGVDLSRALDVAVFAALHEAFLTWQVLVFRDLDLPPAAHVALARQFGEVQVHVMNQYHEPEHPEIYFLSNLDDSGRPSGAHPDQGTMSWHTDGSWRERTGLVTLLYSEVVPERGGETHFCDMYAAWEALSAERQQQLRPLRAVHNLDFSRNRRHGHEPMTEAQRAAVPPVTHPIVRTHPETDRTCLFLGDHAECIEGMDYEAGRALVDAVNAEAIHPDRVYEHRWRPGELVLWDNRCTLHRATGYDTATQPRVMRRCTVLGDAPR
jgi:taurine dioxygenase